MNLREFLSKISFDQHNWDDYGYKQTAVLRFDEENFYYIKVFPNEYENFARIKDNQIREEGQFFLWGQDKDYYQFILETLEDDLDRENWFRLTGDIAYKGEEFIEYYRELHNDYLDFEEHSVEIKDMFDKSFFRDQLTKDWQSLLQALHKLTINQSFLSDYKFTIKKGAQELFKVDVKPKDNISLELHNGSLPLSVSNNVFCIIGENGSGKTRFIRELSKAIFNTPSEITLENSEFDTQENANIMNKIIYCSFSPFDKKIEIDEQDFEYIGILNYDSDSQNLGSKITEDILNSLKSIKGKSSNKQHLWLDVMERLSFEKWIYETIAIFKNDLVICDEIETEEGGTTSGYIYSDETYTRKKIQGLSSGQKIFLLTISQLILKLTERTVVFIDEPELFLHPPMVKSYVRLISDLVSYVNGLGFIITHSPITLQEFPDHCVKVAYRDRLGEYLIKPINFKTFGENINIINDKIFNIGLQQSGYYDLIEKLKFSEGGESHLRKLLDFSGSEAKLLINLFLEGISR